MKTTKTTSGARPILNYTTQIAASKTVLEIQTLLVAQGAQSVRVEYKSAQPSAIEFSLQTETMGLQYFYFAPSVSGVLLSMKLNPKVLTSKCNEEQATRVAWRIEKTWLEANFAKLDAMQLPLEQIMLPYMVTKKGETLYETLKNGHPALPEHSP